MDLNQLQAELSRLGVTLSSNSDPANIAAALPGQRQYRASLYLAQLQAAETFFTTTLAQPLPIGLGAGYAFVQTALQSPELLNSLALSLDLWVGPAVQQHIEANNFANYAAYQNYFNNNILNLVNATYNVNVAAFYVQYPITANAVQRITANFQANIREACERIIADRVNIQNLFIDQFPGLTLDSLKAIKSTGSDFHKGGKQVLILTFATSWWWGYIPWWSDLKVVYKPTDLEVDCLLVGNTAAVNNAIGGPAFQAHSLAEIFNARGAANPPAGFEALPTYRILPRNPTSALPMGPGGLPVRNAYGYIEHLGYDLTGSQVPYTNLYLYGASDFLIFQYQNEVPIITDFYHRMSHRRRRGSASGPGQRVPAQGVREPAVGHAAGQAARAGERIPADRGTAKRNVRHQGLPAARGFRSVVRAAEQRAGQGAPLRDDDMAAHAQGHLRERGHAGAAASCVVANRLAGPARPA